MLPATDKLKLWSPSSHMPFTVGSYPDAPSAVQYILVSTRPRFTRSRARGRTSCCFFELSPADVHRRLTTSIRVYCEVRVCVRHGGLVILVGEGVSAAGRYEIEHRVPLFHVLDRGLLPALSVHIASPLFK